MIKELFVQDINREIETVVKADDERNRELEIKEYVITTEVGNKIARFFSTYNESKIINGVWIHGFFGSGKSHLLKMLSYVLGGTCLSDGTPAAKVFAGKAKDAILNADILKAAQIPSESILFNIDQQADIVSKEKGTSILSVFYKVFFDHLGFYGSQPHIAEFEWWLRFREKNYDVFIEKFEAATGKDWADARRDYFNPVVTGGIASVLYELLGGNEEDYEDILEKIEEKQTLSPTDFTERVSTYLKTKEANFRLNFFIDEVGQFIAGDEQLMLNLQIIAESLGTHTNNRAWVFATAQSAIENLGDDIRKSQDYSKILGRFQVQISLTSANVDEVIEKRLLEKKEEEIPHLCQQYEDEKNLIHTIISPSDNKGMPIKAYKDKEDFSRKYPFLYYQFSLFQECRKSLAEHEVFQGRYAAVGERSMLGVFQEVLKRVGDKDPLAVVSFDLMYEGMEGDIRSEFIGAINNANLNLPNPMALRVLKTLFLVKYFKNFLTTKENITLLLIDDIRTDLKTHQQKVFEALDLLENHSYIERNGEFYEFLTNKEKDVETEIKTTSLEPTEINTKLKELFFDEVLGQYSRKIAFDQNKQDYEFTQKLDGGTFGREKELGVEIITPNFDGADQLEELKMQTMGSSTLRLVTAPDSKFIEDVKMYLKIDKYNKLNQGSATNREVRDILYQKMSDNVRRNESLKRRADYLLGQAVAFVNGSQLEVKPKESGKNFTLDCFQDLIRIVYPNLKMLGDVKYSEDTYKQIIRGVSVPGLFASGDASISEAEQQILNLINRRKSQSDRTSIYDLKQAFSSKPYGWYPNATFSLLGKLYKKDKIEITQQENILDDSGVIEALNNSARHTQTYITAQTVYTSGQIQKVRKLFTELFDRSPEKNEPKELALEFKDQLKAMYQDVQSLLARHSEFPFVSELSDIREVLPHYALISGYKYVLERTAEIEDRLMDAKLEVYDPIKAFINGPSGKIYQKIKSTLTGETANLNYVEGEERKILEYFLHNSKPFRGGALQQAEAARKALVEKVLAAIQQERELTLQAYREVLENLQNHEEIRKLPEEQAHKLLEPLIRKQRNIEEERFISNLRLERDGLSDLEQRILNQAADLNHPKPAISGDGGSDATHEPVSHYVSKAQVKVGFHKQELSTEDDVLEYVEALKKSYLKQIQEHRKIRL